MKPIYMPFTHMTEPTARMLSTLVGPVVVYQPLENKVADSLTALADQGLIEIRSPLTGDEQRLTAALAEFTQWAGQNPGRSTPGTDFVGAQQGTVPYFDESTINRIRSEIKQYGTLPVDTAAEEAGFSARLFLAAAEQNDRTTAHLDQDLQQFKVLEQGFLDSLIESDESNFSRHALGSQIWQEDPGAKRTEQRIRAWATLAAADPELPDLLISTSPAVVDMLVETKGEAIHLEQLAMVRLPVAPNDTPPILEKTLAELAARPSLAADGCEALAALSGDGPGDPVIAVTFYAAIDCPPASTIRQMAPAAVPLAEKKSSQGTARHTLIVLVEPESKSE